MSDDRNASPNVRDDRAQRATHTLAKAVSGKATFSVLVGFLALVVLAVFYFATGTRGFLKPVLIGVSALGILFAVLALFDMFIKRRHVGGFGQAVFALLMCGAGAAVAFTMKPPQPDVPAVDNSELGKYRAKLESWQQRREKLNVVISNLESDKRKLVGNLKAAGINSASDLVDRDPGVKAQANELVDLKNKLTVAQREHKQLNIAITQLESTIRRLDRAKQMKDAGVSEEEMTSIREEVALAEDKLEDAGKPEVLADLERETVLEDELK